MNVLGCRSLIGEVPKHFIVNAHLKWALAKPGSRNVPTPLLKNKTFLECCSLLYSGHLQVQLWKPTGMAFRAWTLGSDRHGFKFQLCHL